MKGFIILLIWFNLLRESNKDDPILGVTVWKSFPRISQVENIILDWVRDIYDSYV